MPTSVLVSIYHLPVLAPGPSRPVPSARHQRHWTRLGLTALTAVALVTATGCSDDPSVADERHDAAHDAAVEAGLDEEVADFLALAARGATATYRTTFEGVEGADSIIVTSRPPDLRVDLVSDSKTVASQITVDDSAYSCIPEDGTAETLTCTPTTTAVRSPGSLDAEAMSKLTESLAQRLGDYTFEIKNSPVAGVDATCLVTTIRPGRERPELGEAGTLCVSPDGVMLRIDSGDTSLEAVEYSTDVDDDAFELPDAEVGGN